MKNSDVLWVQGIARRACANPGTPGHAVQAVGYAQQLFLEELCAIMADYASYFNDLVRNERPEAACRVFKLGNPKPGLMLLRGKDKLVIGCEGGGVRARIVQVHAYNERTLEALDFEARMNDEDTLCWIATTDGNRVNPELVARHYLSPFLIRGCSAFESAVRSEGASTRGSLSHRENEAR